jgi:membrane associated rhomboid family serine protease
MMLFAGRMSESIKYIIAANAFMFIVRLAAPEFTIGYLAITPAFVLLMPWTIFTNMFVHADFMHIFFNMFFGVYMFGGYVNRLMGDRSFLKLYFGGGLFAALFYVFLSLAFGIPNPMTPAVGASGAVYALIGALVALQPNMTIYFNLFFPMPLWLFAAFYLFYSIFALPTGAGGGIAVSAHLGGLIAGYVFGMMYKRRPHQPQYIHTRYY